jgi:hypothetical protein
MLGIQFSGQLDDERREFLQVQRSFSESLHVATALVVSFLGQLAVKLATFHLTAALIHLFAGYSASNLLFGSKCGTCDNCKSNTDL